MKTTTTIYNVNGVTVTIRNYGNVNYTATVKGCIGNGCTAKTAYKNAVSLAKRFDK
jgi:hypothetical protein